ncbi:MAG: endonuclease/exonuclease/phosphatase family protein [Pseudomonadales bacterium]|nr:endonuclease/exonuclease/phosphatase family protein [Pseudomonadales bacterium]
MTLLRAVLISWICLAGPSVLANDASGLPGTMKVLTLNVAHARADGRSQWLQSSEQARQHLWRIANVLKRENPHVAAFQEIDTNSFWNGRFNHTEYVADIANYPHHFSGAHIQGNHLEYGTALVSRQTLNDPKSVRFNRPFARPRKGFVLSTTHWPGADHVDVDVVSVHFDFLTRNQRKKEARKLIEALAGRDNPSIVMGDLNADYHEDSLIPLLEKSLDLSTWQPSQKTVTFPRFQKRLDWVLVSEEIEIVSHEVLPDALSDHRAVVAELRLVDS